MQGRGSFEQACSEISANLLACGSPTPGDARAEIRRICAKYSLERVPKNHQILATVSGQDYAALQGALVHKPVKTASGVAVIALMAKPYACPHGRCTYCPGGTESNSPNSYTGKEPAALIAAESEFDPKRQVLTKLESLEAFGHETSKAEIVIVGGTFLFMPQGYREQFAKSCYDALNGTDSATLQEAQEANEAAARRCVGFTIETKPDYCKAPHIDDMLRYGATRVEIGIQTLQERVYRMVNRGHSYADVLESLQASKDAGFKVTAHMMPGLPTVTPEQDIADFARLFDDPSLRPDMLKIYPSLVLEGTPLYDQYKAGSYEPYTQQEAVRVIAEAKKSLPKWVRIMRVQREILPADVEAGPGPGNLRQLVHKRLASEGRACRCIRCREAGLAAGQGTGPTHTYRQDYESSGGTEVFLSLEDDEEAVYGYLRMRRPGPGAHRPEVGPDCCIVRELHIVGRTVAIGQRGGSIQHAGLGSRLLSEAEKIASEEMDAKRMLVISAVGTRGYYERFGYARRGPYVERVLV